ncbi:MAG: D-2-hydroxyacid dehydrogenase family protein [Acetobacteraceae bacterium]|nr:D-2-hydroxyacid dehydrogenase family protein [Acetobacteraceae bacterium]
MIPIAVLDDWQRVAGGSADWSALQGRAELTFLHEPFADEDDAATKLAGFEVVLLLRERTPFPASLIDRLPKLRMIGATGARTPSLDLAACTRRGVLVCNTGGQKSGSSTAELALGLMIAAARRIPAGDRSIRTGSFQERVPPGIALEGRTLGVIGLGRIGSKMARYGSALGMHVLAWSQNLTEEQAQAAGARLVAKQELLAEADVVSLHLVLSDRTRGIISATDIAQMKPGAILVNTSRGPLVDEQGLLAALQAGHIVAALDVYNAEPLPAGHPLRSLPNTVLTPHLGYAVREVFSQFYRESIENVLAFLEGNPIRVANPDVLSRA